MESTISGLDLKVLLASCEEGMHCCIDCSRLVGTVCFSRGSKCNCRIAKLPIPNEDPSFYRTDLLPTVALVARRMSPFCGSLVVEDGSAVFLDVRHVDWFTVQLISMSDDIQAVVDLKEKTLSLRPNEVQLDDKCDRDHLNDERYTLAKRYLKLRKKNEKRKHLKRLR